MVEKKKPTKVTRVVKPRKKSLPSAVKVTRSRKISSAVPENVIDLSDTFSENLFDESFFDEVVSEKIESTPSFIPPKISKSTPRWSSRLYRNIALTFVILSLLSLGLVVYMTFIRLDIIVEPEVQAVDAKATFKVYDRPEDYQLPNGNILGLVREMEVEYSSVVPASGKKVTGAEVSGTVNIINNYTKDQPLVATTRLLTPNNQLLRLTESVVVPAGGEVEASVYAETADPSFTLANTRLTIPGLWAGLQDKIYAEAKVGQVGYKEKGEVFIAQADIDAASAGAKSGLIEKAKSEIDNAYSTYDQKLFIVNESSIKIEIIGEAGEVKDSVTVQMTGSVNVVAFDSGKVSGIIGTSLSAAGSADTIEKSSVQPKFEIVSADSKENIAEISVTSSGLSTPKTSNNIIDRKKIIGLRRKQLEAYLNESPNIKSYELKYRPSFWLWSPHFIDRIFVSIK